MIETELKIALDAPGLARLRRHPALVRLRLEPRRREKLLSIYCDTAGQALAQAGIALRLRRIGRRWVQTIKHARTAGGAGLFSQGEIEVPAPGGRLVLDGPDPSGVLAAIAAAAGDAPLAPVFETRVERVIERLRIAGLGDVELALDEGEVVAGDARAPILEAEMELVSGDLRAIFALARELFGQGPVRFATQNKSAVGYKLLQGIAPPSEPPVRWAGTPQYTSETPVEQVARDVLRDCFAQIAQNAVVVQLSDRPEGPHQLRVGLRRLRTALSIFGPHLGKEAMVPVSDGARDLGRIVGALRDGDVLVGEVVAQAAELGLDPQAHGALRAVLEAQRTVTATEVRKALAGPRTTAFLFDLLEFVEARGWLAPADYDQTLRLARPIGTIAAELLDKRLKRVLKMGRDIESLEAEALHALRKELKKLRYTVDVLAPIYPPRKVAPYLKALKEMQDTFGSLNDGAMAAEALGPEAKALHGDPDVQRAVGWVLGTLAVQTRHDRPALFARWHGFRKAERFWT